ncbi:MAG TPA: demethoxyubiquinone hydroxylase family protein [Rhizomicrobium sp.]
MGEAIAATGVTGRAFDRTVRQILRVNYAGEYGAIRIYGAQIAVARWLSPAAAPFLEETVRHERRHADAFRGLMSSRATRPCAMTPFWGIGGSLLGLLTGLCGANAMMVCTEAVERTVHAHLNTQLAFLDGRDGELGRTIASIRDEEVGHHDEAQARQTARGAGLRLLDAAVAGLTCTLIWCSTYGALTRMKSGMTDG